MRAKLIAPQQFTQRSRGDYQYKNLERYLLDLNPDVLGERSLGAPSTTAIRSPLITTSTIIAPAAESVDQSDDSVAAIVAGTSVPRPAPPAARLNVQRGRHIRQPVAHQPLIAQDGRSSVARPSNQENPSHPRMPNRLRRPGLRMCGRMLGILVDRVSRRSSYR